MALALWLVATTTAVTAINWQNPRLRAVLGMGWGLRGEFARLTCQGICCHVINGMSVTIQLDLPEALMKEARANGLLESAPIGDLLVTELRRRKAAAELGNVLDAIRAQPGEPLTMEEIQAEVDAVRAERRAREARR